MRLTQLQTARVQGQIGAQALPADHPATAQLEDIFGIHTFFLSPRGLHVVEPGAAPETPDQRAALVKIAKWNDADKTTLLPQGAALDGSVDLGGGDFDDDAEIDDWPGPPRKS